MIQPGSVRVWVEPIDKFLLLFQSGKIALNASCLVIQNILFPSYGHLRIVPVRQLAELLRTSLYLSSI